jgi:ABC-type taurine transport system substrate-binding protein
MARKTCPQCKLVTGASTTTCSRCGHQFAPVAPQVETRARRCAMCGIVNPSTVARCDCGFEFEQAPEDLRAFYQTRRSVGWALLAGSIALGIIGTALIIALAAISPVILIKGTVFALGAVIAASVAGCRKAVRILSATRMNLADLDGKSDALPQARVL